MLCRQARTSGEYLAPGESALGTAVNIKHLAATPVGQRVTAEAVVTGVEGRRIVFAVTARDETQEIGSGIHMSAHWLISAD